MVEQWRDIAGFEGHYKVSSLGNVYSYKTNKILKNSLDSGGYPVVKLCMGHTKLFSARTVHSLVAEAFVPNPGKLPVINHIDECKTNNRYDNLEWCTDSYNTRHSSYKYSKAVIQLLDGKLVAVYASTMAAERATGIKHGNISYACKGKIRTAGGFVWRYLGGEANA